MRPFIAGEGFLEDFCDELEWLEDEERTVPASSNATRQSSTST
jgi:hypothetical protein